MKKFIIIIAAVIALLIGTAKVCFGHEGNQQIKLTIWHYYGGTAQQTFSYLVNNFNQTVGAENNIVVEAYSFDGVSELAKAVDASAQGMSGASPMPSIFATYIDDVVALQETGMVADLKEYFTDEELQAYYEPFLIQGQLGQEQELVILPIAKSTEVLHINKTVFDEFSNDTGYGYEYLETWEGLAQVSEAYYDWTDEKTAELNDGKAFFGTDGLANFMIVGTKQLGQDIFVQDGDYVYHNFTEQIAQNFWDVFYTPYIQGYFSANEYYRSDDVASSEIVAYVGSTASSYYFPSYMMEGDEYIAIECKTMPYPVFENGNDVAISQGAGMAVSASTPEIEQAAAVFLRWFTEEENNCGFAVSTGYMPVKNTVLNAEYIINEMSRDGSVDDSLPIVQATYTTYEQLENYEFYSSVPFHGSDDARSVLENSIIEKISQDKQDLQERVASGEDYQAVLDELISQDNFKLWYKDICQQIDNCLN